MRVPNAGTRIDRRTSLTGVKRTRRGKVRLGGGGDMAVAKIRRKCEFKKDDGFVVSG